MNGSLTQWLPPPDPSGPVTCSACGCRLTEAYVGDRRMWKHFASLHPDQDARGCRPRCLSLLHGRDGRPMIGEAASGWDVGPARVAFQNDASATPSRIPSAEETAAA